MDANTIIALVGSLGFPIVACVGMAFFIREVISGHHKEMEKVTEAIQNNTIVIQKLVDKMGAEDDAK
jgi:hypothetical protein